jgi:hypothetical protein
MSRSRQITVSRYYQPVPEDCFKALALLLKVLVRKEAARTAAPNDAKVRSKHDSRAT